MGHCTLCCAKSVHGHRVGMMTAVPSQHIFIVHTCCTHTPVLSISDGITQGVRQPRLFQSKLTSYAPVPTILSTQHFQVLTIGIRAMIVCSGRDKHIYVHSSHTSVATGACTEISVITWTTNHSKHLDVMNRMLEKTAYSGVLKVLT